MPSDMQLNHKWINENAHLYDGKDMWVALRGDKLLGEAPTYKELLAKLPEEDLGDVLFYTFYKEGVKFWLDAWRSAEVVEK